MNHLFQYVIKRFLYIFPTLIIILFVNFSIFHLMPGSPIDTALSMQTISPEEKSTDIFYETKPSTSSLMLNKLNEDYGLNKSWWRRFYSMVKNYVTFNFGKSFFQDKNVIDLILERLPTTIILGLFSTLFIYVLAVPLGIFKALYHGSKFDTVSTSAIMIFYGLPTFLLGFILIIFFSNNESAPMILTSNNVLACDFACTIKKNIQRYFLPILTILWGSIAHVCLLTKNAVMEELQKKYVITARAKGLTRQSILYHHIFPNAFLVLLSKMPHVLLHILIGSNLVIEILFGLNGIGLLTYESILTRDYPIIFGTLYIYTLLSLIVHILGDITYSLFDPRISFDKK